MTHITQTMAQKPLVAVYNFVSISGSLRLRGWTGRDSPCLDNCNSSKYSDARSDRSERSGFRNEIADRTID